MTKEKSTKRRRWPWIVLAGGVIALALILIPLVSGMRSQSAALATAQAQSGEVVTAFIGDLAASATASGSIAAPREARLSLEIAGTVADDIDPRVRARAFGFLTEQVALRGEVLPWAILSRGFAFDGVRVPLIGPQGIFKPAVLPQMPLSIATAPVREGGAAP